MGMPGAGKSSVGRATAKLLGWPFVDSDAAIEQAVGQSIPDVFALHGEPYFRQREAETLRALPLESSIIAVGGGTPCFHGNMRWMQAHGLTVWLEVPLPQLAQRMQRRTGRPLIDGQTDPLARLSELWQQRAPFYKQAALHCPFHPQESAKQTASRLAERLKSWPLSPE